LSRDGEERITFCSPNRNPSVTGEADVGQRKVSREP